MEGKVERIGRQGKYLCSTRTLVDYCGLAGSKQDALGKVLGLGLVSWSRLLIVAKSGVVGRDMF